MGAPPIRRAAPLRDTTLAEKLEAIGIEFRTKLEHIRGLATGNSEILRLITAESVGVTGCPKKHVVASAFACCANKLAELYGPVRWRCSISAKGGNSKVKVIVDASNQEAHQIEDANWPKILEFMYDFSASNRSLTEVIGKLKGADEEWNPEWVFTQLLSVESELNGKDLKKRRELVCRDLIKLCLIQSELKVLVYAGYEENENRQAMLNAFLRTVGRCYGETPIPGGWLFIGLVGNWPEEMSAYFHVLNSAERTLDLKTW